MKYSDGSSVFLGDKVDLGGGMTGIVVAVIDTGDFSDGYSVDEWGYLSEGALVDSPEGGLMHYLSSEYDFSLLERAGKPA